jgi:hypothetical protein
MADVDVWIPFPSWLLLLRLLPAAQSLKLKAKIWTRGAPKKKKKKKLKAESIWKMATKWGR